MTTANRLAAELRLIKSLLEHIAETEDNAVVCAFVTGAEELVGDAAEYLTALDHEAAFDRVADGVWARLDARDRALADLPDVYDAASKITRGEQP